MKSHIEQQKRQDYLERLYQASGRNQPGHALHGLYTGLKQDLELVFRVWWKDSYSTSPGSHAVMTHVAFAEFLRQS